MHTRICGWFPLPSVVYNLLTWLQQIQVLEDYLLHGLGRARLRYWMDHTLRLNI